MYIVKRFIKQECIGYPPTAGGGVRSHFRNIVECSDGEVRTLYDWYEEAQGMERRGQFTETPPHITTPQPAARGEGGADAETN